MSARTSYLVVLVLLAPLICEAVFAQEVSADKEGKVTKKSEDAPSDASQALIKQIKTLIQANKPKQAVPLIEKASAINDADMRRAIRSLRAPLAISFLRNRQRQLAAKQIVPLIEYQIQNLNDLPKKSTLAKSLAIMRVASAGTKNQDRAFELVAAAYDAVDSLNLTGSDDLVKSLAPVVLIRSQQLQFLKQNTRAREILTKCIAQISESDASETPKNSDRRSVMISRLMGDRAALPNAIESDHAALDLHLESMLIEHKDSKSVANEYVHQQMAIVGRLYGRDPAALKKRIEDLKELLNEPESSKHLVDMLGHRLKSYQSRVDSAERQKKLIGKPAPNWNVDRWLHLKSGTPAPDLATSLRGKVVLMHFWSVWSKPSIKSFSFLRSIDAKYPDNQLQLIGVTRYFNYRWDESTAAPVRSKANVAPADEREMLERFLNTHKLKHPAFVTSVSSRMQKDYAVTGLPYFVIIDRKGNIRLIKVGSDSESLSAMTEQLKELLR